MNSPRVIISDELQKAVMQALAADWESSIKPWLDIAPNSVHIVDHYIQMRDYVKCQILCVHKDSDEVHKHTILMLHSRFDSLLTADEFAAQLQRESEIDETN